MIQFFEYQKLVVLLHNNKSYRGNERFLSLFCFVFLSVKYFNRFDRLSFPLVGITFRIGDLLSFGDSSLFRDRQFCCI